MVVFPTIQFLEKASADSRRWSWPRSLLLLIIRTLALTAIALAFTMPRWEPEHPIVLPQAARNVVLLVDASASMQRSESQMQLFESAREQALAVLSELDPRHDHAAVVLMDRTSRSLLPEISGNLSRLKELLRRAKPTDESADVSAALKQADSLSQSSHRAAVLDIIAFTDMQTSQWREATLDDVRTASVRLEMKNLGNTVGKANCSITNMTTTPAIPIVNQTLIAGAVVTNHGNQLIQASVTLSGSSIRSQTISVQLKPGTSQPVRIPCQLADVSPAYLELTVNAEDDVLAVDDRVGLFVEPRTARQVMLMTADNMDEPTSGAYFVRRALLPDDSNETDIELQVINAQEAISPMRMADAVVIVSAGRVPDAIQHRLLRYLHSGGAVLWIVDSQEAVEGLAAFNQVLPNDIDVPIVPAVASSWGSAAADRTVVARFEDPLLSAFEGASRSAFGELHFSTVMRGRTASEATNLLTFNDGQPLLAHQWIGRGRLAVLATSIAPAHSDLVKRPLFVAMLHELVRNLAPGPGGVISPTVGSHVSINVNHELTSDMVVATGPDGAPLDVLTIEPHEDRSVIHLGRQSKVGRYELRHSATNDLLGGTFVEADPRESNLTATKPRTLKRHYSISSRWRTDQRIKRILAQRIELWPWLTLLAVVFLVLESLLMGRFDQSRGSKSLSEAVVN